jgi:putative endonuclease
MNKTCYFLSLGLLLGVALISGGQTPSPALSGIEGVISVSPNRPGPIKKDRPNIGPARNVEFVVKKGESKVATFTTDEEGHFRILLSPGHYVVMREDAGSRIGHWRFEADVLAGEVTKVNWTGDSGMR